MGKASQVISFTEKTHAGHAWLGLIDETINPSLARMVTRTESLSLNKHLGKSSEFSGLQCGIYPVHLRRRKCPVCAHVLVNIERIWEDLAGACSGHVTLGTLT